MTTVPNAGPACQPRSPSWPGRTKPEPLEEVPEGELFLFKLGKIEHKKAKQHPYLQIAVSVDAHSTAQHTRHTHGTHSTRSAQSDTGQHSTHCTAATAQHTAQQPHTAATHTAQHSTAQHTAHTRTRQHSHTHVRA